MARLILDASAALALINRETGWSTVAEVGYEGLISTVSMSEVVAKLTDQGCSAQAAEQIGRELPFTNREFDASTAFRAGALRAGTRRLGLSLGDRACLALAEREGLPVLTADHAWAGLDIGVEVRLIR